ncbi:hypothetical protein GCM10009776_08140 [Microbacterium deminutum]|uniref:Transposase n=1 Tax=Microbacterium deminutum TaxID=344164 RepID=A0ABN2QAP4_9MICO
MIRRNPRAPQAFDWICANLDEDVAAFRDRPLADTSYPFVFLDATYCKARVAGGPSPKQSWLRWASPRTAEGRSSAPTPLG